MDFSLTLISTVSFSDLTLNSNGEMLPSLGFLPGSLFKQNEKKYELSLSSSGGNSGVLSILLGVFYVSKVL